MNRTAALIVGLQEDYLPGGSLKYVGGNQIIPAILQVAEKVDVVIATREAHPPDHFSFSKKPLYKEGSWPPHCIHRTKGNKLQKDIKHVADYVVTMGMSPYPPDAFSAFAGGTLRPAESLEQILQREEIKTVMVVGIGQCLPQTAFDANALGYNTMIIADAHTLGNYQSLSTRLVDAGILFTTTEEL